MSTPTPNRYILLADDDPDDRMLFEEALRDVHAGAKLALTFDGKHLLEYLEQNSPPPPDVIFLDLNMPRMNGHQCLEAIKKQPGWSGIPIIIFSTSASEDAVVQGTERRPSARRKVPKKQFDEADYVPSTDANGTKAKRKKKNQK